MFIPISPGDDGSVPKRYQSMCQGHQVSTSVWSPEPRLPLHPSFPVKFLGVHLLWTHSNESGQAVESLCPAKLIRWFRCLASLFTSLFLGSNHSKAAQVSVSNLAQKRMRKRKERLNFFLFIFSVGKMLTLTNVHID